MRYWLGRQILSLHHPAIDNDYDQIYDRIGSLIAKFNILLIGFELDLFTTVLIMSQSQVICFCPFRIKVPVCPRVSTRLA